MRQPPEYGTRRAQHARALAGHNRATLHLHLPKAAMSPHSQCGARAGGKRPQPGAVQVDGGAGKVSRSTSTTSTRIIGPLQPVTHRGRGFPLTNWRRMEWKRRHPLSRGSALHAGAAAVGLGLDGTGRDKNPNHKTGTGKLGTG